MAIWINHAPPHRILEPKAQALHFVQSFISPAGDEQPHFSVLTERQRFECKKQPFTLPARTGKEQHNLIRFQFQIFTRFLAKRGIKSELIERNAVANDVDTVCRIAIKIGDLVLDHL